MLLLYAFAALMIEGKRSIGVSESDEKEDGDRSWTKIVQGSSRALV